jgi:hypothetical protein
MGIFDGISLGDTLDELFSADNLVALGKAYDDSDKKSINVKTREMPVYSGEQAARTKPYAVENPYAYEEKWLSRLTSFAGLQRAIESQTGVQVSK